MPFENDVLCFLNWVLLAGRNTKNGVEWTKSDDIRNDKHKPDKSEPRLVYETKNEDNEAKNPAYRLVCFSDIAFHRKHLLSVLKFVYS